MNTNIKTEPVINYTALETELLSSFNEGNTTFDKLADRVSFNEKTLKTVLEQLLAKNVLKFNTSKQEYEYETPVKETKIILDGNLLLPMTIIKKKNKDGIDKIYVSRGPWYEFDADFDIRRIIWNVELPSNKTSNSTLVDLVKNSVLKVRKSKLVQVDAYKVLCGKIIPWSENIHFEINTVGEDQTDITLMFVIRLFIDESEDAVLFREFSVRTLIDTNQLISEVTKPSEERQFSNIEINKFYNFTDFVFANNSIPYEVTKTNIKYAKITGIRGKLELTHFEMNNEGAHKKIEKVEYPDFNEGLNELRHLFTIGASKLLDKLDFALDTDDEEQED